MSPFYSKVYSKEGEDWAMWKGEPRDIRGKEGVDLGVTIFNVPHDSEEAKVSLSNEANNYVSVNKRFDLIFPGESSVVNRRGFVVVDAQTRRTVAKVIYRKPVGKK